MSFLRRHSLVIGILLMFAITWTVHLSRAGILPLRIPFPLALLGGWGFALAAVIMTWLTLGRAAVVALLKRFLLWRIGWKWYASLLIIPGAYLLGMFAHALVTGVAPDFRQTTAHATTGSFANALLFVLPVFLADVLGNSEECRLLDPARAEALAAAARRAAGVPLPTLEAMAAATVERYRSAHAAHPVSHPPVVRLRVVEAYGFRRWAPPMAGEATFPSMHGAGREAVLAPSATGLGDVAKRLRATAAGRVLYRLLPEGVRAALKSRMR